MEYLPVWRNGDCLTGSLKLVHILLFEINLKCFFISFLPIACVISWMSFLQSFLSLLSDSARRCSLSIQYCHTSSNTRSFLSYIVGLLNYYPRNTFQKTSIFSYLRSNVLIFITCRGEGPLCVSRTGFWQSLLVF